MRKATFRIIHFTKVNRYVGLAWNYDEGVLLSTNDQESRTKARLELDSICEKYNVKLQWFDGEYTCAGNGYELEPIR